MEQAEALKGARARERMTQQMLADAAGVNARTVMRAEAGERVSHENVRALYSVLKLDASKLDVPDGIGAEAEAASAASPAAPAASASAQATPRTVYVQAPENPTSVVKSAVTYALAAAAIACGILLSTAALFSTLPKPGGDQSYPAPVPALAAPR